jgi:hypothetical protein
MFPVPMVARTVASFREQLPAHAGLSSCPQRQSSTDGRPETSGETTHLLFPVIRGYHGACRIGQAGLILLLAVCERLIAPLGRDRTFRCIARVRSPMIVRMPMGTGEQGEDSEWQTGGVCAMCPWW